MGETEAQNLGGACKIEPGDKRERRHEGVGREFFVRPAILDNRVPPVGQEVVGERSLAAKPFVHTRVLLEQAQKSELAAIRRSKVEQVGVGELAVEQLIKRAHVMLHTCKVKAMFIGPRCDVRAEVLKSFVQFVARVFGPIGADAVHSGICNKEVARPGANICADGRAGKATGIGHAVRGHAAIGKPRTILVAHARRLGSTGLYVDLETGLLGRVDEFADDRPFALGQFVGRSWLIGRIPIELTVGDMTRRAAHP